MSRDAIVKPHQQKERERGREIDSESKQETQRGDESQS